MERHLAACCALALMLAVTAGCSRVTAANYDKLKSGQSFEDVQGLLGAPDHCSEALGLRSCQWGDEKSHIVVNFVGGKAALFSAENIH